MQMSSLAYAEHKLLLRVMLYGNSQLRYHQQHIFPLIVRGPKMVERSQGVMDWSLLAEGYERVKQKFELDYWAGDVRGDGDGDRDVVEGRYELR